MLNGRYGPYIAYDGKNYRLPKNLHEKAGELSYEQCMEIVKQAPEPKSRRRKAWRELSSLAIWVPAKPHSEEL